MQVDGGHVAAGVQNEIAVDPLAAPALERCHGAAAHRARPVNGPEDRARHDTQARGSGDRRGALPAVDDGRDLDPEGCEERRHLVGAVAVGRDDGALPAGDAEPKRVLHRGAREHDARPVAIGEEQRALEGARRRDHRAGADLPQPLAEHALGEIGRPFGTQALDGAHEVVVVDAEGERAESHVHAELSRGRGELADLVVRARSERPSQASAAGEQHGARPGVCRGDRGRKAGDAAADHQHVRVGGLLLVMVGVGQPRRLA